MKKEKLEYALLIMLGLIAGGFIFMVVLKYIFPVLLPFLIAWGVALVVRGPAERLSEKIRVPEKVIRTMMAVFVIIVSFGLLAVIVWQLTAAVWRFLSDMGEGNPIYDILTALTGTDLPIFGDYIPPELAANIRDALMSMISSALTGLATAVTSWVGAIPGALLFVLVTVIAMIYFAVDLEKINGRIKALLPEKISRGLSRLKKTFFGVGKKYVASYLLLMVITFGVVLVGLLILGVEHAALVALVIALLDVLPVIGVGTVIVPWSIFALARGNHALGIGLIILFIVNTVIRQFAEPKIVGKNLDMHPLLTLVMLYAGYSLFGIVGLLLVPVGAVIVGALINKNEASEVA